MIVIGCDILPGTSALATGENKSKFALTALRYENLTSTIIEEISEIDYKSLLHFIQKLKPDFLAFDNLQEIASNTKELIQFAKRLPDTTTIIQVTGNPNDGFQKLQNLASKINLWNNSNGKPDAMMSSNLIARLVTVGIGYKVLLFEDEVKISISKTKGIGRGGWSQPRYERNMRISVNNVAKEIQDYLDEFNIEYDNFNYSKSIILVIQLGNNSYVKYSDILSLAKKVSNELAFAHVQKIPKSALEYIPLSTNAPKKVVFKSVDSVIIGLDPGTTTGLAILSARTGAILYLYSAREFSTSQIIRKITKFGKAVLVCADVNFPPPYGVQRLSRNLGAQIYAPSSRATARTEKRGVVQDYLEKYEISEKYDNHCRDALFAAIKGFNSIKPKIISILKLLADKNELQRYTEKLIDLVLSGITSHDAITLIEAQYTSESLTNSVQESERQHVQIPIEILSLAKKQIQKIDELQLSLRVLERDKKNTEKENVKLTQEIQSLNIKIENLESKFQNRMERDRVIQQKTVEIINLEKEKISLNDVIQEKLQLIDQLKRIRTIWIRGEQVPLKPINKLHFDELEKAQKEFGIRSGDVLLILDPSGGSSNTAKWLVERKIRAIIIPRGFIKRLSNLASQVFESAELPVLEEDIITYKEDQDPTERKRKIVIYEDIYIINKRYLLKRLYEAELDFIKKREFLRIKRYKETLPQDIDIDKNSFEYLLFNYQNQRAQARTNPHAYDDYEGEDEDNSLF